MDTNECGARSGQTDTLARWKNGDDTQKKKNAAARITSRNIAYSGYCLPRRPEFTDPLHFA